MSSIFAILFFICCLALVGYYWYKDGSNPCPKCNDGNNTRLLSRIFIQKTQAGKEYFDNYKCNACGYSWQEYFIDNGSDSV